MNENIRFSIKSANFDHFINFVEAMTKITQRDVNEMLDEVCTAHLRAETRGYGGKLRQKNIEETKESEEEVKVGRKEFIKPGPTFLMARYLIEEYGANPKSMRNGVFQSRDKLMLLKRLRIID